MKKLRFRWSLSSSKLLALTAFYFSVILNYPFYTKVLSIHPLTHTSADYLHHAIGDFRDSQCRFSNHCHTCHT